MTRTRAPTSQPSCATADGVPVACPIDRSKPGTHGQRLYRLTDLLTRPVETWETAQDAEDTHLVDEQVSEIRRNAGDTEDARRMAHNPEVAGSNPAPATKARGRFSNREPAFCLWLCTDLCAGAVRFMPRRPDCRRPPGPRYRSPASADDQVDERIRDLAEVVAKWSGPDHGRCSPPARSYQGGGS